MVHPGTTRSLMLGLIVAAFFVAGCGGGGDDVSRGTHDMLQEELDAALAMLADTATERDTAQTALTAANAEVTRLTMELETANGSVTSLMSELSDAEDEVTRLTNQIGSVTDPTSLQGLLSAANAEVTRLTTELGNAEDEVTDLTTRLTSTAAEVTRLQGRLDTALDRVQEVSQDLEDAEDEATAASNQASQLQGQLSEAQQAEIDARASAYLAAINMGGAPRTGHSVEWDRGGSRTVNPGGNFVSGSGAPSISGFTAHTYTRRVSSSQQTAYMYTNIQAPGNRPFWQLHGVADIMGAQDDDFDPKPTGTARVATVAGDLQVSVSGTYDGVSGTYTCTTGCDISDADGDGDVDTADFDATDFVMVADGERSFAAGTWEFRPSSVNSPVQQMSDNEHLYFGIWVLEPNVASEMHNYQYIVGGQKSILTDNVPTAVAAGTALANFDELTGTAQFTGGAIGKFVTRNQVGENARIGTFNATATFTADFGDATAVGTLEGRITNFQSPGQTLEGQWYLYLGALDTTTTPNTEVPALFTGGSIADAYVGGQIGGVPVTGMWDATLYGSDNMVLTETERDDYPVTRYPVANLAGIAGNFHAMTDNAALAGAFGVTPR